MSKQTKRSTRSQTPKAKSFSWKVTAKRRPARSRFATGCSCGGK